MSPKEMNRIQLRQEILEVQQGMAKNERKDSEANKYLQDLKDELKRRNKMISEARPKKQQPDRTTRIHIIINEETLQVVTSTGRPCGEPLRFETAKEADEYASERLGCWNTHEVYFKHPWIEHAPNIHKAQETGTWCTTLKK